MAISAENRAYAAAMARKIVELTGGRFKPDGRSKTFDEIEDEATELGDLITSLAIEHSADQEVVGAECERCPKCDCLCKKTSPEDDEALVLQTARGEVAIVAEAYFCRRCRRSFFPSAG